MHRLLIFLLTGCVAEDARTEPASASPAPVERGWADELASLDGRIAFHQERFSARPDRWTEGERLAALLHQRARLSGDYGDYARAEAVYAEAFAVAPQGSGPLLSRARLHFTLHRLPDAQADLAILEAQPLHTAATSAAMADLAADIAAEQGRLAEAREHWAAAEQAAPTLKSASALGRLDWLEGDFEAADGWFSEALDRYHATPQEPVAWIHLQRGLIDLDQGQPAAALVHYTDAEVALPGYWLVDEHIAEALALTGQREAALARYRDVVARTGSPELQGALAGLLLEDGPSAEAEALLEAAAQTYAEQRAAYPEAATGHALDFALEWQDDPAAALEMAEANAALRPSGAALSRLSQARLAAGDSAGALAAAEQGLATGVRSAELLLAAAEAAEALGSEAAADYLAQARGIDPSAG